MSEQAAERALLRQRDLAHRRARDPGFFGQVVVLCESIVDEHEVGIDEHSRRQVVANHRTDEGPRLQLHRLHEVVVEAVLGIEPEIGLIAADMTQAQPIVGEVLDEPLEADAGNEAVRLALQCFGITKLSRPSQFQQRGIGSRVGQEMRQPRRDRELIVGADGLAQVDEVAR